MDDNSNIGLRGLPVLTRENYAIWLNIVTNYLQGKGLLDSDNSDKNPFEVLYKIYFPYFNNFT